MHTEYEQQADGLKIAEGDRLIDVLAIWSYRIKDLSKQPSSQELYACSQALVPRLIQIISNPNTDLASRSMSIKVLCTIAVALNIHSNNSNPALQLLVEAINKGLSLGLKYPLIIDAKEAVDKILHD